MANDLTDAKARRITRDDKPMLIGGVPGLYLHATRTPGRGKWTLRFVSPVTGKRRDMGLGSYPETGIAAARKLGLAMREQIAAKLDPIQRRKADQSEIAIRQATPTFAEAANEVHASLLPGFRNIKHGAQWITTLETYAFPIIGDVPVTDLRASDFAKVLRPIWLEKPETASRIKQRCDTVMNWCAAQDLIVASPVGVVSQLLPKQPGLRERVKHFPAAPWRTVAGVVSEVLRQGDRTQGKRMLEFLILTAARSGEVRGMTWQEVEMDDALWTIPKKRMKARTEHRVPLSEPAISILREAWALRDGSEFVFPSRKGTPISDMTLTKLLRSAKVPSDTDGRFATAHGFRSSFRDWASENGHSRDLAERALAHTIRNATEAAYHRTDLLEARRELMREWADFVTGNVVEP